MTTARFDSWPDQYDRWFDTPVGRLVRHYEAELLLELLNPRPGERILDVGCGTGIFTRDVLDRGALVTGIDLSVPMLTKARSRLAGSGFQGICADMCRLPFADGCFDQVFSMTAIEFVADAGGAVAELHRVTRRGGRIVVTTLNSRSPWAEQRRQKGQNGHDLFQHIHFRSPEEMRLLVPSTAVVRTAIHFGKHDPVTAIPAIEQAGNAQQRETGAFLAVCWHKA
jgi:ubiquinone/menaquinone biosynthesis C-methylase UbiE